MASWVDRTQIKAYNLEDKFSISFDHEFGASKIVQDCADDHLSFDGYPLRVRADRSIEVRNKNRLMGNMWKRIEDLMKVDKTRYELGSSA